MPERVGEAGREVGGVSEGGPVIFARMFCIGRDMLYERFSKMKEVTRKTASVRALLYTLTTDRPPERRL
jgi:hypothetical protein